MCLKWKLEELKSSSIPDTDYHCDVTFNECWLYSLDTIEVLIQFCERDTIAVLILQIEQLRQKEVR